MGECEICGKDTSLREVNHEDKGRIMVCQECWSDVYEQGKKVTETSTSDDSSSGLGCPHCG